MEVDTGAALSIISEETLHQLWPDWQLTPTQVRLQSYSGEAIQVLGSKMVQLQYKHQVARLPLLVVKGAGPSLFGRNWLQTVRLHWHEIHWVHSSSLQDLLQKYSAVFSDGLGTLEGFEAKISIDPNATPRFFKARSVPYALRDKVEAELERLVNEGTLELVQFADWASPIVAILKNDR